jgi:proclavaminate amidinohydrolase
MPYDGGTSYRPGSRFGPRAVREESCLLHGSGLDRGPDVFERVAAVDAGDIDLSPFSMELAMATATEQLTRLANRNDCVLMIGGDHSLTLGALRAAHARHGRLAVLHLDAHSDTFPPVLGGKYHHGTPFRWAIEEGLVDASRIVQVGIRGHVPGSDAMEYSRSNGVTVVTADDVDVLGVGEIRRLVRDRIGTGPVYVSCDIDVADPAFAPGTGTPAPGGLTSREVLAVLAVVGDLDPVGFDVVEVSPPYDWAGVTALLAAELAYEMIYQYTRARERRRSTEHHGGSELD